MLLLVIKHGVEKLQNKLLLFAWKELDLLELALELRLRAGLTRSSYEFCKSLARLLSRRKGSFISSQVML